MVTYQIFSIEHIPPALELWERTDHIGLSSADRPDALASYLDRNPGFSFVALDDGRLVGAVLCGHDGRRGFVHHLAVAAPHRKAGMGSRLLNLCLEALSKAGIHKCHAFVFRDNPYGELFWQPAGWQRRDELFLYSKSIEDRL
jgi:putative acetyltransferase